MRKTLLAAAFAAASVLPAQAQFAPCAPILPVQAQSPPCTPIKDVLARLAAGGAHAYAVLEDDAKARLIRFAREDAGDETLNRYWDLALIAVLGDGSLLLAVGRGTDLCAAARVPAPNAPAFLARIFGAGA